MSAQHTPKIWVVRGDLRSDVSWEVIAGGKMAGDPNRVIATSISDSPDDLDAIARASNAYEVLVDTLQLIRGQHCESFTSGLGSCFRNGRTPDAEFGADRCCKACIADAALSKAGAA